MGADKTTTKSEQKSQATPEEIALNRLQLEQAQAFDPQQRMMNENAGTLVNRLLTGQSLPGYLNTLPGGISPDVTQTIVDQSLRDLYPQFQSSGILDSGVAASIAGRTAGDIRASAEQFNIQNLQQLLNLAVGGQAQVQQPMLNTTSQLGNRLAGLRSTSGTSTVSAMNPFMKSFQTSFGQGLGSAASSGVTAGLGAFGGGSPSGISTSGGYSGINKIPALKF